MINFSEVIKQIKAANSITLTTHARPDGDALGGTLALRLALLSIGKTVNICCDDKPNEKFLFLTGINEFVRQLKKADLTIAIDCGDLGRLGAIGAEFAKLKTTTISIDHHLVNNPFAAININSTLASTCQMIYQLIIQLGCEITKDIALCLYLGLSTDTGNFTHGNTDKDVFSLAAKLIDKGFDVADLSFNIYKSSTFDRNRLIGTALAKMRSFFNGKIVMIIVTQEDLVKNNATMSDTEGFTDYTINTIGCVVGVCICEHAANSYKVSMRSRGDTDVSQLCLHFGGGGHKNASGCMVNGLLEDVIEKLVRHISLALETTTA